MKNVLVLGSGYLGSAFKSKGYTIWGKENFNIEFGMYSTFGIFCKFNAIRDYGYDTVINCIAKSDTRFCEANYDEAFHSNALIPTLLSIWCKDHNVKLVHISTGCLYDRNDRPQKEDGFLAAHCNYTLTKWQGEKGCDPNRDLIIRPRLFFDASSRPNNLLNKVQRFDRLCDEMDSVSSVDVVVNAVDALIQQDCTGVFNVACLGYTSMQEIGHIMGLYKPTISIEEIRAWQKLHLVNSIMDLSKLTKFYQPPYVTDEVKRCFLTLQKS